MTDTSPRQENAFDTENAKKVIADRRARQTKLLERAIFDAACSVYTETDKLVPPFDCAIKIWNSTADQIDRKTGGQFEIRLVRKNAFTACFEPNGGLYREWAFMILNSLMVTEPAPVYDLMSDMLFISSVPEADILRHAKVRLGFWNTTLRKRRWASEQRARIEKHERDTDLMQDQRERRARVFRRNVLGLREKLERDVRADPAYNDFVVGWPHGWRTDGLGGLIAEFGMLVPLTENIAPKLRVPSDDSTVDGA